MSGLSHIKDLYLSIYEDKNPSFEIKKSSGVGALTADAAKQLGPKAEQLRKKKAAAVDLPKVKKEELELEESEKWIQKAIKKPGALRKQMGVESGEKIPAKKLAAAAKKGGKLGQRARLAQTLMGFKEENGDARERMRFMLDEAKKEKSLRTTNPCWKGYEPVGTKKKNGRTVPNCVPKEEVELLEKAPPGAKYERMVKHIKKRYSKDGLTDKERAIAYATAWKSYKKQEQNEEYLLEKARGTRKKTTVHAYDVDETLFSHGKKGKPNVKVHVKDKEGKRVKSLSNQEFNTHKVEKGHSYDFGEFRSAKKFKETSSPNKKVIKDIISCQGNEW